MTVFRAPARRIRTTLTSHRRGWCRTASWSVQLAPGSWRRPGRMPGMAPPEYRRLWPSAAGGLLPRRSFNDRRPLAMLIINSRVVERWCRWVNRLMVGHYYPLRFAELINWEKYPDCLWSNYINWCLRLGVGSERAWWSQKVLGEKEFFSSNSWQ